MTVHFIWLIGGVLSGSGVYLCWRLVKRPLLEKVRAIFLPLVERSPHSKIQTVLDALVGRLEVGVVPESLLWEELAKLPLPWGVVIHSSVQLLRKQGASVLPTLKRFRELSQHHQQSFQEAKARASQALAQAGLGMGLAPAFSGLLLLLLPEVQESLSLFVGVAGVAVVMSGFGALWVMRIATESRWGGLSPHQRGWITASVCASEQLVALLRAGLPADVAWAAMSEELKQSELHLAVHWGGSVWSETAEPQSLFEGSGSRSQVRDIKEVLISYGSELRWILQQSLIQGRPAIERIELSGQNLRKDWDTRVRRELELLSTRTLKPLFLCVAPSLLGLLAVAVLLSMGSQTWDL